MNYSTMRMKLKLKSPLLVAGECALCAFLLCKSCFIRISTSAVSCGSCQRLPRRAHAPMIGRAGHTRLGTEPGHRSAEARDAVPKFRVWHVCARCHRNKKNLCAILRSCSELVSRSDRILLLIACRPRARVIRAYAVATARRGLGARIGRLGAPCKAGVRCCSLTHGCRCRRTPQFRATTVVSAVPSTAQPCGSKRDGPPAVREPRRYHAGYRRAPSTIWTRMGRASRQGRLDGANL